MNRRTFSSFRNWALAGVAVAAIASPAWAEEARQFQIPSQSLVAALEAFGKQGNAEIIFNRAQVEGHAGASVSGSYEPAQALAMLLDGSGLKFRQVNGNTFMVEAADPQSGSAAGDGADGTVAALVVTAQKREENIQDVPIAISAFTEKSLDEQKIEGGFDLLKAIPNVTFSKNNFTSYNFSIRGIGTKAVSATTDPGVAVSFNNTALLQNRLFEQEYFDVERVEVLRGPQGTLYGRNATAGVINVISAKPNLHEFDGWVKGEVGNYHAKRISAMVNIPLVEDKLAVRFAGALTDRQGYDYNEITKNHVNGRDLWSGRVTVAFNPTERIHTDLIWERFNEDDNRSRTGKQLCHRDPGPASVGGVSTKQSLPQYQRPDGLNWSDVLMPVAFSQGCLPGSLYDDQAFSTPNGMAISFVYGLLAMGGDCGPGCQIGPLVAGLTEPVLSPDSRKVTLLKLADPYGDAMQSRDLRTIASLRDPIYRAKADVLQLNAEFEIFNDLKIFSQTVYNKDNVYSFQDYNRFNTQPVFNDTRGLYFWSLPDEEGYTPPSPYVDLAPGGVYCDPQIGCSNTMVGVDISKADAAQFSQELRVQSSFEGPWNFSAGANYTTFNVEVDYYVMFNLMSAMAALIPFNTQADTSVCGLSADPLLPPPETPLPIKDPNAGCVYVDPNPLEQINGEGHNYFRSRNPYDLRSAAVFGEVYWQLNEAVKVTGGLRYTKDRKRFTPVPSQALLARGLFSGGDANWGYPEKPALRQEWGEFTGRLGVDWKLPTTITDQSMLYAFYSRGYKGGGMNPPGVGFSEDTVAELLDLPSGLGGLFDRPVLMNTAVNYPPTFRPEFVNAIEVGAKNTLFDGGMTLNLGAFLYDYQDYQVSKIVDRTAVNENFDARIWGAEMELAFRPNRSFALLANVGYLDTAIGAGAQSIDIMNRTQGNPDYVLARAAPQLPSNCVVPTHLARDFVSLGGVIGYWNLCGGWAVTPPFTDTLTGEPYDARNYPEINGGAGLFQNLKGNELPNSPHWTANLGGQYTFDFLDGWRATIRADGYWQSQSWARVYNAVNDKLHGWYNANLSLWLENDQGLKIELYAKNILDKTPITDSFINSDDTALTTNVFVLDPRLIGLSIKKGF